MNGVKDEGYKKGQFFQKGKGYSPVGSAEHKSYLKNFKTKSLKVAMGGLTELKKQRSCVLSGGTWVSGKCQKK